MANPPPRRSAEVDRMRRDIAAATTALHREQPGKPIPLALVLHRVQAQRELQAIPPDPEAVKHYTELAEVR